MKEKLLDIACTISFLGAVASIVIIGALIHYDVSDLIWVNITSIGGLISILSAYFFFAYRFKFMVKKSNEIMELKIEMTNFRDYLWGWMRRIKGSHKSEWDEALKKREPFSLRKKWRWSLSKFEPREQKIIFTKEEYNEGEWYSVEFGIESGEFKVGARKVSTYGIKNFESPAQQLEILNELRGLLENINYRTVFKNPYKKN
jgi:hypothetical protein